MERGVYETNNQTRRATFKYEQEGQFCLGVAKSESQDGTIIGKRCLVFDYTDKKIVTIYAYKTDFHVSKIAYGCVICQLFLSASSFINLSLNFSVPKFHPVCANNSHRFSNASAYFDAMSSDH